LALKRLWKVNQEKVLECYLPHYEVDVFIDETKPFRAKDSASVTPILGRIHSIRPNSQSDEGTRELHETSPFIIGFYCGKGKPSDIDSFLNPTIDEFIRLSPDTDESSLANKRHFTASLRCVIADSPMRSYLKQSKGHSGYWACDRCIQKGEICGDGSRVIVMRNVNAPLRNDADFLSYHVNDFSNDDHLDPNHISPFVRLNHPMVTGFVIDPMHTMIDGAFGRRLIGFASVPGEGKLSKTQLAEVNTRIAVFKSWKVNDFDRYVENLNGCGNYKMHVKRQFLYYHLYPVFEGILPDIDLNHIMMLQYSMLLLGSFESKPVHNSDIIEAQKILNMYAVELSERDIPCRFVSHQITHMPQDVAKYKCGIEKLSAFQYESFLIFFP
jgi:hypothetical protein